MIAKVLAEHPVDTVVHLDVSRHAAGLHGGRSAVKETNVIGTMQLLGACQKAPVGAAAGGEVHAPASTAPPRATRRCSARTSPAKSLPSGGFAKDAVEVEGYVRGFARRRPDVAVCGAAVRQHPRTGRDSPLAEYFALPVLPTVLGYDPRLQFVHEDDAVEVLRLAAPRTAARHPQQRHVQHRRRRRAAAVAGGPAARQADGAGAAAGGAAGSGRCCAAAGLTDFSPEQIRLLTHGRVVDTTQMRETLGFTPRFTTAETFADFAAARGPGLLPPDRLARAVDRVAAALPEKA